MCLNPIDAAQAVELLQKIHSGHVLTEEEIKILNSVGLDYNQLQKIVMKENVSS